MIIQGLQKLTLLDYPGKLACTVFLAGCNFRCPFCHNASLVTAISSEHFSEEDVLSFLKKRQGKLEGVCITGGEPLLCDGLDIFIAKIKELGYLVKLDTNGSNPKLLKELIDKKLVDYVAMDVKNSVEKYPETVGLQKMDVIPVMQSVSLLTSGVVDYEFRTTIVKQLHSRESILEMGKWLKGAKALYLQQFEDSGDLISLESLSAHSKETMEEFREILLPYVEKVELRGVK